MTAAPETYFLAYRSALASVSALQAERTAAAEMMAPPPSPLHHYFAGQLVELTVGRTLGLHCTDLMLIDDAGRRQIVYIAHGHDAAGLAAQQALASTLQIGRSYYGTATLCREGDLHRYLMGAVQLHPDKRRARFCRADLPPSLAQTNIPTQELHRAAC